MHTWFILSALLWLSGGDEPSYSWESGYASVSPRGDIQWTPRPFSYRPGEVVRYVDYEGGDDARSGTSPDEAWKHHPWDADAIGNAAAFESGCTYVFKGGVTYRGTLEAEGSGSPTAAIQLTRDPQWGEGPAVLTGAEAVTGWSRGGAHPDTPKGSVVYTATVDWLPRTLWVREPDGKSTRMPLARTPNWTVEGRDDIKANWWRWTNKGVHHYRSERVVGERTLNLATDHRNLTDEILEHAVGATMWSEYGWVMGTPYPSRIFEADKKLKGLVFGSQWSDNNRSHIVTNCRYYLEDSPYFLDDPSGEHWVERLGDSRARIHLIFPPGLSPSNCIVEAGRHEHVLSVQRQDHIHVSGLHFRYTNTSWELDDAGAGAAIDVVGPCEDLAVTNCQFSDIGGALTAEIVGTGGSIDQLLFADNDVLRTDETLIWVKSADSWGKADGPFASVERVRVLRNRGRFIGMRPDRISQGHAIHLEVVRDLHAAGNVLDMCWGSGIFVYGGKNIESNADVPFARLLIHENKVTNAVLNANDFGGIETWQGGPAYVFNNVVGDVRGYWHYNYALGSGSKRNASFGHAFYLDGAFKNYHFNNVAYGRTQDWSSPFQTCSAFQEVHSYQNTFFNNTLHSFRSASRRKYPQGGRNKFLGNIFDGVSEAFLHGEPPAKGRAADQHPQEGKGPAYATNAFARNVFHGLETYGRFEEAGPERGSLAAFASALVAQGTLASGVGVEAARSPLPDAARHDFTPSAAVDGKGVKVFVPWALCRNVAEWNFYPSRKDGQIIDEHWYMSPNYAGRGNYHAQPMWSLEPCKDLGPKSGVRGPLEDWTAGAVSFNGTSQYYSVPDARLDAPVVYRTNNRGRNAPEDREFTLSGEELPNPELHRSNLLIEVYFRCTGDGILIRKMDSQAGYALSVQDGKGLFSLRHQGVTTSITTGTSLVDGRWHHLIVEADRSAGTLTTYVDGARDSSGPGLGPVSLANAADLHVGGSPRGGHISGAIDFMRICQGTLAEAQTTIEELHAWEFAGPHLRDFSGRAPGGAGRDAGAIEGR